MANAFTLEIRGLDTLQTHLKKLGRRLREGIQDESEAVAYEIMDKAVRNLTTNNTVDQGILKNSMQVVPLIHEQRRFFGLFKSKEPVGMLVTNTAIYAPFVEFGTKTKVSVPAEWTAYAQQFKGYKGLDDVRVFRQAILEWIRRKHITPRDPNMSEQQLAFYITRYILRYGLTPRPFMYPAYKDSITDFPQKIERVVNRLIAP